MLKERMIQEDFIAKICKNRNIILQDGATSNIAKCNASINFLESVFQSRRKMEKAHPQNKEKVML